MILIDPTGANTPSVASVTSFGAAPTVGSAELSGGTYSGGEL